MTTQAIRDFLTKELFVRRNVVTYRSLSRELGVHVNKAKNELEEYHKSTRDTESPAVPTYLVSGQVASRAGGRDGTPDEYSMDLDFDEGRDPDVVHTSKVMLVTAKLLDDTISQFSCIPSVHIYSLSPSELKDAGLICSASTSVHKADATRGLGSFHALGKICGAHVQLKDGRKDVVAVSASSSKIATDTSKQSTKSTVGAKPEHLGLKSKTSTSEVKAPTSTEKTVPKVEAKEKSKSSGKLNLSKAKTKEETNLDLPSKDLKAKAPPKPISTRKLNVSRDENSNKFTSSRNSGPGDAPIHRGVKRKSHVASDLQEESPSLSKPISVCRSTKVENDMSVSDDDESHVRIPGRRRYKPRASTSSDPETSLRAMMDIDDAEIIKAPRAGQARSVTPAVDEDIDQDEVKEPPLTSDFDDDEEEPIVKPKRKKSAKAVPVGRNGLKKKRVMKTRTTTDAKGYMQTEDYSSYESVDDDAQPKPMPKGKKKSVNHSLKVAEKPVDNEAPRSKPKTAAKTKSSSIAKRGSLLNFFGPDKK